MKLYVVISHSIDISRTNNGRAEGFVLKASLLFKKIIF